MTTMSIRDSSSPSHERLVDEKYQDPPAPGDFVYDQSRDHVQRTLGKQHIQM